MAKFDLNTSKGLSNFLKNLKRAFTESNMDIRQTKDSKLLHRAADAFDKKNWSELAHDIDNGPLYRNNTFSQEKKNDADATLKDLLALNEAIENGDYSEDVHESIYNTGIEAVKICFGLGSDRDIYFTVKVEDGEFIGVESALIEVRGFGTRGYNNIEGEALGKISDLFESQILMTLNDLGIN